MWKYTISRKLNHMKLLEMKAATASLILFSHFKAYPGHFKYISEDFKSSNAKQWICKELIIHRKDTFLIPRPLKCGIDNQQRQWLLNLGVKGGGGERIKQWTGSEDEKGGCIN